MSQAKMLVGFALYAAPQAREATKVTTVGQIIQSALDRTSHPDAYTIATPPGCRLMRIVRLPRGWRLWVATRDFVYGTYYELFEDGRILNCTVRADEGDDYFWSRPADKEHMQ